MRVANLDGRLVIVTGEVGQEIGYDVEKNSGGQFSADPAARSSCPMATSGSR